MKEYIKGKDGFEWLDWESMLGFFTVKERTSETSLYFPSLLLLLLLFPKKLFWVGKIFWKLKSYLIIVVDERAVALNDNNERVGNNDGTAVKLQQWRKSSSNSGENPIATAAEI